VKYVLRDYQIEASNRAVDFFNDKDDKNGLMVLPAGSGKSLILADIAKRLDGDVLILQPTKEILEQNYEKYLSYGLEASIYSASFGKKEIGKVTFAMIGSIIRKRELFIDFKYLLIDECHLVNSKGGMYEELLSFLNIKALGVTASPIRLSTDGYGGSMLKFLTRTRPRIFKRLLYYVQIKDLLDKGYLVRSRYQTDTVFDSSKIRLNSTGADFVEESLRAYCEEISQNDRTITAIKENLHRRGIICFVPFVKDAEYIADKVDGCVIVTGKTSKKERERILEKFRAGEIKAIVNSRVLVAGFDYPELDTIIISKPTMSLAMNLQIVGRGMRPFEGKQDCLVIDLTDNYKRFGEMNDLMLYENGRKPYIANGNRQLTNVYFSKDNPAIESDVMPFGKFKGTNINRINKNYLHWVFENCTLQDGLKKSIADRLGK